MHPVTRATVPLHSAGAESPAGPGHSRGPARGADATKALSAGQPGHELRTGLRRPPAGLVDDRAEGGDTAMIEFAGRGCGDQAGLDHAEVLARHRQSRWPRRPGAGPGEYAEDLGLAG